MKKPVASEASPVQPKETDSKPKGTTKDLKESIPVAEISEKVTSPVQPKENDSKPKETTKDLEELMPIE